MEFKVTVPEGYEIDKENSTFECIKFKPVVKKWRDNEKVKINGYYIVSKLSNIRFKDKAPNDTTNRGLFSTYEQAKSALAMARISQIMDNDSRFGGVVTYEEWRRDQNKYIIEREYNNVGKFCSTYTYHFLAFHTEEQRDLFLDENLDLIKDYLML